MGLPPTEPREYCRPAVRLRVVGGSGGNGSLAGTESILASCHESSRSKTFTRTQSRCMAPLTLNLSASMVARRDTAGPSGPAGGWVGCRSRPRNGEPVERATGPNGPKGQRRARSLWFVVVIQLFGLWRPWRRPPRSGPADRTSPEAARRPVPRSMDDAAAGPRTTHRGPQQSSRPSAVLSSLHHTPPPYNPLSYTFGVRGSFASCIFFR